MRECGDCSLCCKVLKIPEPLNKPAGMWCEHFKDGVGCSIYGEHPDGCKNYKCGWLERPEYGDEWFPNKSKIIIMEKHEHKIITFIVDTQYPNRWRDEPYYSHITQTASNLKQHDFLIFVDIGNRRINVCDGTEWIMGQREKTIKKYER